MARVLQPLLQDELGVSVRISNIPGGATVTGNLQAFSQPADGYTILLATQSSMMADVFSRMPFKFMDEFVPLARIQAEVGVLWGAPDGRFSNIQQAIDYAKGGNRVTVAISSPGGIDDASVSSFAHGGGFEFAIVPLASGGERLAAVIGGHVDLIYEEASAMADMAEVGGVVPLIVFSDTAVDTPLLANVPYAGQFGISGLNALGTWRSWVVRKDTPPEVQARLLTAFQNVYNSQAYQEWAADNGLDMIPGWLGPQETRALFHSTITLLTDTFNSLGRL
jgi:tripartite-type tricarboxylate transporter receptor subunit TctC